MDKLKQRQKKIQRKRKICLYVNNLSLRKKKQQQTNIRLDLSRKKTKIFKQVLHNSETKNNGQM